MFVIRRIVAFIGVIVGICGTAFFGTHYGKSWAVVTLAAFQSFVALCNFLEARHRVRRKRFHLKPGKHLPVLRIIGLLGGFLGLVGLFGGFSLAIYHNEKLTGSSHYIVGIWGFLLLKWGIITMLFCDMLDEHDQDSVYGALINVKTGTISDDYN
eukprot:m.154251 g.154251  ORF g.154251 m.154251 type:complete len:155 (+) comp13313_c6_seq1:2684-3148(+)